MSAELDGNGRGGWERVLRWWLRRPLACCGVVLLFFMIAIGLLAPVIAPYDPVTVDVESRFQPPSVTHVFGTDELGRDLLSRLMYGTRISFGAVGVVLLVSVTLGVAIGGISGYAGGFVDEFVMRLTDVFLAFPPLLLALAIAAALGPGLENSILAVCAVWWNWYARLVRGQVLATRGQLFVLAAQTVGASDFRILVRHILPNCMAPVIVLATLDFGMVLLVTAGLSFIGLGARPPTPELGSMIDSSRRYLLEYPWISAFPGLAILMIALGANLLGDAMRDFLDPVTRAQV